MARISWYIPNSFSLHPVTETDIQCIRKLVVFRTGTLTETKFIEIAISRQPEMVQVIETGNFVSSRSYSKVFVCFRSVCEKV